MEITHLEDLDQLEEELEDKGRIDIGPCYRDKIEVAVPRIQEGAVLDQLDRGDRAGLLGRDDLGPERVNHLSAYIVPIEAVDDDLTLLIDQENSRDHEDLMMAFGPGGGDSPRACLEDGLSQHT